MDDVRVISETIQEFRGERYYLCGYYFQRKGKRLHRAVWEAYNGEIPEGYHVHHIDEDRANNSIENLSLMPGVEHINEHARSEKKRENGRKAIKCARDGAARWHKSEAGKSWHSELSKKTWSKKEKETRVCSMCGKEFETRDNGHKERHFCSNNCKAEWRRKSGVDDEARICPVCGRAFFANKHSRKVCCGYECARIRRWGK